MPGCCVLWCLLQRPESALTPHHVRHPSGLCLKVLALKSACVDFGLHPSSILLAVVAGHLTVWDLKGGVERLRTIALTDDHVPLNVATIRSSASATSNHVLLTDKHLRVIVDFGRLVKTFVLPLSSQRGGHDKVA